MKDRAVSGQFSPTPIVILTIAALCVLAVGVAGEPPARAGYRLIYVFNPDIEEHLDRALAAQSLLRSVATRAEVVGVVRGQLDEDALPDLAPGITFDLISEEAARADDTTSPGRVDLIEWLAQRPGPREDRLILEDATGIRLAGDGAGMESVAAMLAMADDVATRVEFTTWGKMKELFQ